MIRILVCAAALAAASMTGALAHDAAGEKVTLVYDHVLPNVPGKSIRGVLVEYCRAAHRPLTPIQTPPSFMQRCWRARSEVRSTTGR